MLGGSVGIHRLNGIIPTLLLIVISVILYLH